MGKKKEREVWRLYGSCGVFSLIVPRRSTMLNVGCVGSAVGYVIFRIMSVTPRSRFAGMFLSNSARRPHAKAWG